MKLLFLDESETHKQFFLISGLLIDSKNLLKLNSELNTYRDSLGVKNFKHIRKDIKYKREKNIEVSKKIYKLLNLFDSKILCTILGNTTTLATTSDKRYLAALSFLMERFALQIRPEQGMVLFDQMGSSLQGNIEHDFNKMIQEESLVMKGKSLGMLNDYIYPSISFVNDDFHSIIQVADLISTSFSLGIRKSIEQTTYISINKLREYSPYLDIYWPLVVKSWEGKADGWGVKLWN